MQGEIKKHDLSEMVEVTLEPEIIIDGGEVFNIRIEDGPYSSYISYDDACDEIYSFIKGIECRNSSEKEKNQRWILTNISQDIDGHVYAGKPSFFKSKDEAIKNARENLADDFSISVKGIKYEAQEGENPYVLSMSRDGHFEAYTVAKIT